MTKRLIAVTLLFVSASALQPASAAPPPAEAVLAAETAPAAPAASTGTSSVTEAGASDTTPVARHTLPPIVVTASRLRVPFAENPGATTVVEHALRSMPRAIAADEALKLVPGVKVDNQADGERVHMSSRGIGILTERGVRGIKVLLDDLPLNDPSGFAPDLFDVDWATIQRIEVFRGPASALYGGGSAGGVMNLFTRDGEGAPVGGRADFTGGSYGFKKELAEASGLAGKTAYRASFSRTEGDGYREHTAYSAANLYSKFSWHLGNRGRLTGIVGGTRFFNNNAEGLNLAWLAQDRRMANPDALTYNEFQKTERATVGFTGQVPARGSDELDFSLYARHTHFDESVPSSVLHRGFETPGGFVQYSMPWTRGDVRNRIAVGLDVDGQVIDEMRRPNLGMAIEGSEILADQTIHQRSVGAYVLDRVELAHHTALMLGVRHDSIKDRLADDLKAGGTDLSGEASFSKSTARVGASWNPLASFGAYASWGQGFLPPATEELSNNPERFGGFNARLVPATSSGEEVGARGTVSKVSYDVAVFHLQTENDFGRYRVPDRPLETFYQNTGKSQRYGAETLLEWWPTKDVTLQAAYTFSHFRYDHAEYNGTVYENTWVPNSPKHQAYLDAEYRFGRHFTVGVGEEIQNRWAVDPSNRAWVEGFGLLNARCSARWDVSGHEIEAQLAGRNLTGKEYIAFSEPDPDGNSYQPGPTEEFYGGLQVRF
ncbi:MAG: TonB-dependent receptor [bacterium]